MPLKEILTNQTLHALGFLCWMMVGLGIVMRWDAQSTAVGGVVPHDPRWASVGLYIASIFAVAAVGCHVAAFFVLRKEQ